MVNMGTDAKRRATKRKADQMTRAESRGKKVAEPTTIKGAMSLLLKKQLQSKILTKRQCSGLENIPVDFTPKPTQPLTPAEKDQEKRRKESNRRSAILSRQKVKEEREQNDKMLSEEQTRKADLTRDVNYLSREKSNLLNILQNNLGLSLSVIEHTLSTITSENKLLETASGGSDEDRDSVFYLQHSEQNDTTPDTSFSTEHSEESPHYFDINDSFNLQCSEETVIGSDVITGNDAITGSDAISGSEAMNQEWETTSTGSSDSVELQIIEGGDFEDVHEESEQVVIYICYADQTSSNESTSSEQDAEARGDASLESLTSPKAQRSSEERIYTTL